MSLTTSPFESDEFKKLQAEWNKKLKESGFVDVEANNGSGEFKYRNKRTIFRMNDTLNYFSAATELLNKTPSVFKKTQHKEIWALHIEGNTIRAIADRLGLHKTTVGRIIIRYRNKI